MISKIAKTLGVSEESVQALPADIISSMKNLLENVEVKTEEDAKTLYAELDSYWTKGTVLLGLNEVAKDTGIDMETLKALDFDTQQELVFEYMADSSNTDRLFEITNKALAILEIESVAKVIGKPVSDLKQLTYDTQVQLCGIYAMESDELSEFELRNRLNGVLDHE